MKNKIYNLIFFIIFSATALFFYRQNLTKSVIIPPAEPEKEEAQKPVDIETATTTPEPEFVRPVKHSIPDVPFTAQAPFGDWDDVKQDYGCEEACLLMAMHWVRKEPLSPEKARDEIVAISEFELKNYQHHHDYSIADTLKVLQAYFSYENAFVEYDISLEDIKDEIARGNLVIIPINGRAVTNPYFNAPGPFYHQILVIGYDDGKQQFTVHDPGTRQGANFKYNYNEIGAAIMDYPTGLNEPVENARSGMLVINHK